jgi:hypothetical protein
MEFDHVIEVHADGTITEPEGEYGPELNDGRLEGDGWELITHGYTGQHAYRGPIMHSSEFIGGRLEDDIRDRPGLYVAVVANYTPEDGDDDTAGGWAVAFKATAETDAYDG